MQVFISYNHNDRDFAETLKNALEAQGVDVTIDIEALKFGDSFQEFAEKSMRETDFTIFIVSQHSLRSAWVVEEFLLTRMHEKVRAKKKFLPVAIDEAYFDDTLYLRIVEEIDKKIEQLKDLTAQAASKSLGTTHLDQRRERLLKQRNSLDKVLKTLQSVHVADFSTEEKFRTNLPKLLQVPQEKPEETLGYSDLPAMKLGYIHNFDLGKITKDCLEFIYSTERRLIGFAVCCSSTTLLSNLCRRLQDRWGNVSEKELAIIKKPISINPIHTSVHEALSLLERRCNDALENSDVIIVVHAGESAANTFWETLYKRYSGKCRNRLIVIVALSSDCKLSETITKLSPPEFRIGDMFEWVQEVVKRLNWPKPIMKAWVDKIIALHRRYDCLHEERLNIELVYDHLEEALQILQRTPAPESFINELK